MSRRKFLYILLAVSTGILIYSLGVRYDEKFNFKDYNKIKATAVKIHKRKVDIGKVPMGSEAKAVFFLYNTGSEKLFIENVEVSCSCSSSTTDNTDAIAPGDSIPITVFYNKKIPGYFYTDVIVHGNFEKSPEILSFEGYLLDPLVKQ